jgi:hypothetical protein
MFLLCLLLFKVFLRPTNYFTQRYVEKAKGAAKAKETPNFSSDTPENFAALCASFGFLRLNFPQRRCGAKERVRHNFLSPPHGSPW